MLRGLHIYQLNSLLMRINYLTWSLIHWIVSSLWLKWRVHLITQVVSFGLPWRLSMWWSPLFISKWSLKLDLDLLLHSDTVCTGVTSCTHRRTCVHMLISKKKKTREKRPTSKFLNFSNRPFNKKVTTVLNLWVRCAVRSWTTQHLQGEGDTGWNGSWQICEDKKTQMGLNI